MNYRHAFHAGNHADVLKHVVLLALIDALRQKEAPFFVLDTHAGRGEYALASNEHRKTGESDGGVLRLFDAPPAPAPIERYLKAVAAHNVPGRLQVYPGSPLLVADALRPQDRMAACELQPDEATALKALFHGNPQVAAHARDGYDAVSALLPPRVDATRFARGLVLIDPPYESQQAEFPPILDALRIGLERWPQGTFAVWYPIKQRKLILHFLRKAALLPAKSALVVELLVRPDDSPLRLNGSGMLVLNPPWRFDAAIKPSLVALGAAMADGVPSTRLDWLRREDGAVEAPPPRARDLQAAAGSLRQTSTTREPASADSRGADRRRPDHRNAGAAPAKKAGTARPSPARVPSARPAPARPSAAPRATRPAGGKRPPKRTP